MQHHVLQKSVARPWHALGHFTSTGMVFFPSFLLVMLSDPKVTLPPAWLRKLESKGEDGSWHSTAGTATCPARWVLPQQPVKDPTPARRDIRLESRKQWEITVSPSSVAVPVPRQSSSPLSKAREKPTQLFHSATFTASDLARHCLFRACKSTSQMPEGPVLCPGPHTHILLLLLHNKNPHHSPNSQELVMRTEMVEGHQESG